jgi:uncharacterized repeat protein (TIGR02543 family)
VYAQTVASNSKITEPDDPTRDDEVEFVGWYRDNGTFKNEFDFNTPITNDTTLYAKWSNDKYTLTINYQDNMEHVMAPKYSEKIAS